MSAAVQRLANTWYVTGLVIGFLFGLYAGYLIWAG